MESNGCVFCAIVEGTAPAAVLREWVAAIAIVPLHPVTVGHTLVLPRRHVVDALEVPAVTAMTMECAAEIGERPCNLITSAGRDASQSIMHLHVHVVPRKRGDGFRLPWTR